MFLIKDLLVKAAYAAPIDIFKTADATSVDLKIQNVQTVVSTGIKALIGAAGLLFFVMLVWGGIQFVTSGGDKAQATAAKDRITHALLAS
ncbi:MAG: hypothetical protein NT141_02055 [candidate division WWE3 bacterium]|nr:hypothetical protein [candidate division WWE3 bacterium]